jgi:hypothetical protein
MSIQDFTQQVEKKAHEIYEKRGSGHGNDWDDWFEAEKLVEKHIDPIERDCIRSESLFEATHRALPFPSGVDASKINKDI